MSDLLNPGWDESLHPAAPLMTNPFKARATFLCNMSLAHIVFGIYCLLYMLQHILKKQFQAFAGQLHRTVTKATLLLLLTDLGIKHPSAGLRIEKKGHMWVSHLGRDCELSCAYLTWTNVPDCDDAIEKLNGRVNYAISPTVIQVRAYGVVHVALPLYVFA